MTKQNKKIKDSEIITCMHCKKVIISPKLNGLTLVCPHCSTPVNGQYSHK